MRRFKRRSTRSSFKRSRSTRRRTYRRRSTRRRQTIVPLRVHSFKRTFTTNISAPVTGGNYTAGVIAPTISQLPSSAEFTSLFEYYKITKLKYRFYAKNGYNNTSLAQPGVFHIWNDFDDNTSPTATEYLERGNVLTLNMGGPMPLKGWSWSCRPKVAVPVYRTGVTFGYSPSKARWINTSNNDVVHYGTKYVWDQVNSNPNPPSMFVEISVYFKCKQTK